MIISPGDLVSFKHSVGTTGYPKHVFLFHAGTPVLVTGAFYDIAKRYGTWSKFQTENNHMFLTPEGRIVPQKNHGGHFSISFLWNDVPIFIFAVHRDDIQVVSKTKKETP